MKLITRDFYMEKLVRAMGTPDIKVITGIRRCGKSKLLEAFKSYIETSDPSSNVIHVNFNLAEFEELMEFHALREYVERARADGLNNYVLIDEVQMCQGFEKAINGFHASELYDIYITGSNAFLLSSDLATLFTGRTFEVEVFPFSFSEYLDYFGSEDGIDAAFENYTRTGGMSGSYVYAEQEDRYAYLANVFDTLILRDVGHKYDIRNPDQLARLSEFMMDNVSNLTSARGVASALTSIGDKANDKTIGAYLNYLCDAFAFYKVRRYDIRGKKYLTSGDKYYLADHAFRYAKLGTRNMDWGRVYENMVAIELIRRGWQIYAGVLYNKEIDFVALRRGRKIYVQVSDNVEGEDTFEREVGPLLKIRDAYPKMLIANTRHDVWTYEGVEVYDLARWLAGDI